MLPIYVKEAETYSIAVESGPKKALELKKEPVFEWLNPAREHQQGAVFLWLRDGRPAALGVHLLPPAPQAARPGGHARTARARPREAGGEAGRADQWKPEAGLARKELPDAPAPADDRRGAAPPDAEAGRRSSPATASIGTKKRWELRLLPTPLYRYPTAKTGVIDGALFALMSTAGTDPEVLLLIEAHEDEGKTRWEYACGRFSDWELRVQRKDKEVFVVRPGRERTRSPRPAAPVPHLPGEGRDPGGQAARPDPSRRRTSGRRTRPRRGQVTCESSYR